MPDVGRVALLTGGSDKHYAYGLTMALLSQGVTVDLIGSDEFEIPEFSGKTGLRMLNLRGDMRANAGFAEKMLRILRYYARLIRYATWGAPSVFHILWNNKFETIDRTFLMCYYRLLGKKVVLTAHNVNTARRDQRDTFFNRLTLSIQYALCHQNFVHTVKMKTELESEFGVPASRITIIPYGINNAVPDKGLSPAEAKQALHIGTDEKVLLFFGRIAPAKGLDILVSAFERVLSSDPSLRLIIAGRPDRCPEYWSKLKAEIDSLPQDRILLRDTFIPDQEIEVFFRAADVLVLPYRHIYQSGVLFLGQSFGIPALVADVGSLKEDISASASGMVFNPSDTSQLVSCIHKFFQSELFSNSEQSRQRIMACAIEEHSWTRVAQITTKVYGSLAPEREQNSGSLLSRKQR